ncbi:uncharacterized protein LOC120816666 [Gasterosteus aculeatus]
MLSTQIQHLTSVNMDKLAAVLFFSTLVGNTLEDDITANSAEVLSSEGSSVSLSCNYSVKANNLQWYRQNPGSSPQFLLLITDTQQPSVVHAQPPEVLKRFTVPGHHSGSSEHLTQPMRMRLSAGQKGCAAERRFSCFILLQWKNFSPQFGFNSKDMLLYFFLPFFHFIARGSMQQETSMKPESTEEHVSEGRSINLTCKYQGTIYSIQWYRQYRRSIPEFLLYITEEGSVHQTAPGVSAHINKTDKRVDLEISSAAVSDSAVYYCAVRPTVTGNTKTLYKNLWSKDISVHHPPEGVSI